MNLKDFVYRYPFLFVFSALLSLSFFLKHNYIFILFVLIFLVSIAYFRVFVLSFLFLSIAFLLYYQTSNYAQVDKKSNFTGTGTVLDIRKNRNLSVLLKTEHSKIYLFASKIYDNIEIKDNIYIKAKLKGVNSLKNEGFRHYLQSINVKKVGFVYYIKKMKSNNVLNFIQRLRKKLEREFYYFLPEKPYIFLQNAIFGDSINKNLIRNEFIDTQTAHIMSVSGLHMSFVFGLFYGMFYFIISRIKYFYTRYNLKSTAAFLSFFPTVIYFLISGGHIPAIRSFAMLLSFIISLIYGLNKNAYNILFFSASLIVLFFGVRIVFNPSFVMSFFMTFVAIYLYRYTARIDSKTFKYVTFTFLMSIFAMPISVFYFGKLSYLSFLSNSIAIPYFGVVIMPASFVAIFVSFFNFYLLKLYIFHILSFIVKVFLNFIALFSQIKPVDVHISIYAMLFLYLFLFATVECCGRYIFLKGNNKETI